MCAPHSFLVWCSPLERKLLQLCLQCPLCKTQGAGQVTVTAGGGNGASAQEDALAVTGAVI